MSASCQHLIRTIHFVIALMKRQAACSCSTFFFRGVCVCLCELSMGKALSVAERHSLAARSVGSCQFGARTEWEACSVHFSGRVFTPTQFCTAVSYICIFWVCLYCHTYTWEHYFATRCPFERALVFQAVIGTAGVHDSSLWGQEARAAPWLLQWWHPATLVSRGWGTRGASAHSAKSVAAQDVHWDCLTWIHPKVTSFASISLAWHTFKQVCNPSWGCLGLVTHKWLSTFLNLFLALQAGFRQFPVSL